MALSCARLAVDFINQKENYTDKSLFKIENVYYSDAFNENRKYRARVFACVPDTGRPTFDKVHTDHGSERVDQRIQAKRCVTYGA